MRANRFLPLAASFLGCFRLTLLWLLSVPASSNNSKGLGICWERVAECCNENSINPKREYLLDKIFFVRYGNYLCKHLSSVCFGSNSSLGKNDKPYKSDQLIQVYLQFQYFYLTFTPYKNYIWSLNTYQTADCSIAK